MQKQRLSYYQKILSLKAFCPYLYLWLILYIYYRFNPYYELLSTYQSNHGLIQALTLRVSTNVAESVRGKMFAIKSLLIAFRQVIFMLFGCPTTKFGSLPKGHPHSLNVNYCAFVYL